DWLAGAAAVAEVDARRFRMTIGVGGVDAFAEDRWPGRAIGVGSASVRVGGNVGRCAVTTKNPSTGAADLRTLHVLARWRGEVDSSESLPFGVWGEVVVPGVVRLGDALDGLD
ncbi:MAG: MOSC domain-containing protein, partial [Streptosporangiaceae bacterium]